MAGDAERIAGDRKDPVVETGDRDFVEHKHDLVNDVGAVKPFASSHARVGLERVPMSTVTVYNGCGEGQL